MACGRRLFPPRGEQSVAWRHWGGARPPPRGEGRSLGATGRRADVAGRHWGGARPPPRGEGRRADVTGRHWGGARTPPIGDERRGKIFPLLSTRENLPLCSDGKFSPIERGKIFPLLSTRGKFSKFFPYRMSENAREKFSPIIDEGKISLDSLPTTPDSPPSTSYILRQAPTSSDTTQT